MSSKTRTNNRILTNKLVKKRLERNVYNEYLKLRRISTKCFETRGSLFLLLIFDKEGNYTGGEDALETSPAALYDLEYVKDLEAFMKYRLTQKTVFENGQLHGGIQDTGMTFKESGDGRLINAISFVKISDKQYLEDYKVLRSVRPYMHPYSCSIAIQNRIDALHTKFGEVCVYFDLRLNLSKKTFETTLYLPSALSPLTGDEDEDDDDEDDDDDDEDDDKDKDEGLAASEKQYEPLCKKTLMNNVICKCLSANKTRLFSGINHIATRIRAVRAFDNNNNDDANGDAHEEDEDNSSTSQ